ncbi:interference hedgehog isoform X1 [Tribolium castaneum]|uniref:interference hedgehog isoform X1 n=1 Tax=Tribolium castaneum TaxID=7070 RepID=UPI00046C38DB|nr:PREDICTED: interference hedgehog isoform X1 [Tribolium castaneum]|eukprot:XP_008192347.1 PREDICTED: interference hedgehog isoform X1 [Tribolium castaneum]
MDGFRVICILVAVLATTGRATAADHVRMVTKADLITVPLNFDTSIVCTMNIVPDNFQWKFYPLSRRQASNPKAHISLTHSHFEIIDERKYEITQKKTSTLNLQAKSDDIAGDYQCLAYYGASVVASIPWRLTIANISEFPPQEKIDVTVIPGNTVNWRCEPPEANPEPYIDYHKNGVYVPPFVQVVTKSLIIPNVTSGNSGSYTCKAGNVCTEKFSPVLFNLKVDKRAPREPPKFIVRPRSVYNVTKGDKVLLECSAVGNPLPKVVWRKITGIIPEGRSELTPGGLIIKNISASDNGIYECTHDNSLGKVVHSITLNYNEAPTINCPQDSIDVNQGEDLELECTVTGNPDPEITWFLNGFVTKDNKIITEGNKIFFKPTEKRHAGNLQVFARNIAGTVYSSISIKVIPLSTTQDNVSENPLPPTRLHRPNSRKFNKHAKMYPPSKPNITGISDEAVVLRWTVQNKGLPIQFFKVQYKDFGPANQHDHHNKGKGSKWNTDNPIIEPHIRSYQVNNLKPDHVYRFRIAAVYSNSDNKNSPNSDKFHLRKLDFDKRNPLPVPLITKTESINTTAVKIYWKCEPSINITIDGFFVNYNSASSAGDYTKATVDGPQTNSFVLSHLQPDTVYDIKLQSFNSKSASDFSSIMKAKTLGLASTTLSPREPPPSSANTETAGISKLYVFIAAGVLGACGVLFAAIGLLLFCRKQSKQKKTGTRGDHDKACDDHHHIQADATEYVVSPKSGPRTNGCVAPNRITITANPLADADNKVRSPRSDYESPVFPNLNQNMIEMSCLSSQNNNCSTGQPSVSGEDSPTNSRDKKNKNREKRIRNKHNVESNTAGENYV